MTCREKLAIEHPEDVGECFCGGCANCPSYYGYMPDPKGCTDCAACWDREIPDTEDAALKADDKGDEERKTEVKKYYCNGKGDFCENYKKCKGCSHFDGNGGEDRVVPDTDTTPHILDSGHRRKFASGAVRDVQEGKGRCDLLPLDVIAMIYSKKTPNDGRAIVLGAISDYMGSGRFPALYDAIEGFMLNDAPFGDCDWATIYLEVSKHFEEGCKKYGENNWQKGIPTHCYIDSAVRHYLKWARGDKDEPHDRAFCWNILCCIWTCIHKPELNDYAKETENEKSL